MVRGTRLRSHEAFENLTLEQGPAVRGASRG